VLLTGANVKQWRDLDLRLGTASTPHEVKVRPIENLADAFHLMTGETRVERVLAAYCEQIRTEWQIMRNGDPSPDGENHRLDHFIEPHLKLADSEQDSSEREEHRHDEEHDPATKDSPHRLQGGVSELVSQHLLQDDRWPVIFEDAGVGKTVLTLYLQFLLTGRDEADRELPWKPMLVVRCEQPWPNDIRATLEAAVADVCEGSDLTPAELVTVLLNERRIVLILDGMDQVSDDAITAFQTQLFAQENRKQNEKLRIIITSRAYRVRQRQKKDILFGQGRWQSFQPELFDEWQQEAYLADLPEESLNELMPQRELVRDLTPYPVVLKLIREMVEAAQESRTPLRSFKVRGDLYLMTAERLLERAFLRLDEVEQSGDIPNLLQAIACIAIEMMLKTRADHGYSVPARMIPKLKTAARARFVIGGGSEDAWQRCERLMQNTLLTDRCLLQDNDSQNLSFRSLKMLEFFAGLYLGAWADESIVEALRPFIGSEQWFWPWRFAIELEHMQFSDGDPVHDDDALRHSLTALVQLPKGFHRPSELIVRAEGALNRTGIIAALHQQFIDLLHSDEVWPEQIPRATIDCFASRETVARWRADIERRREEFRRAYCSSAERGPDAPSTLNAPGVRGDEQDGWPVTMEWASWTVGQIAAQLVPEYQVRTLIENGVLTARRWKQIAPQGWNWFIHPAAHGVTETDDATLNAIAICQLKAWESHGFIDRWTDPVLNSEVYFPHDERNFVAIYPLNEHGEVADDFVVRFRESLEAQAKYSAEQIDVQLDRLRLKGHDSWIDARVTRVTCSHAASASDRDHDVLLTSNHDFRMSPIWLQSVAVSRAQHSLFDHKAAMDGLDGCLLEYKLANNSWFCETDFGSPKPDPTFGTEEGPDDYAGANPAPDVPAIGVTFWDSAAFSLWCGQYLPSEVHWQFGARFGRRATDEWYETQWCRSSLQQSYLIPLLPVRWTSARRFLMTNNRTREQDYSLEYALASSVTGLWQMNVNVGEWVVVFESHCPGEERKNSSTNSEFETCLPQGSFGCVLRNNLCYYIPKPLKLEYREAIEPDWEGCSLSFRLLSPQTIMNS
jgi:hypothetical protein